MTRHHLRQTLPRLAAFAMVLLSGCGGADDDPSPAASGGTGGTGGSLADPGDPAGGAPSGMVPTGGTGGQGDGATGGGTSGENDDELCSPGDFVSGPFLFSGTMTNCFDWDPGDASVEFGSARSIALPTPTSAGEPYAISFAYHNQGGNGTLEYYATDGECGPVVEKLSSETMNYRKVICTDTVPTGNYEHLVMVWTNVSASLSDATFCPNVTCND